MCTRVPQCARHHHSQPNAESSPRVYEPMNGAATERSTFAVGTEGLLGCGQCAVPVHRTPRGQRRGSTYCGTPGATPLQGERGLCLAGPRGRAGQALRGTWGLVLQVLLCAVYTGWRVWQRPVETTAPTRAPPSLPHGVSQADLASHRFRKGGTMQAWQKLSLRNTEFHDICIFSKCRLLLQTFKTRQIVMIDTRQLFSTVLTIALVLLMFY